MTAVAHLPALAHDGTPDGTRAPRRARAGGILRIVGVVVLLLALVGPLALGVAGARMLVVDGGSMAPAYAVGDVLLVAPPTGVDLVVGEPVVVGDGETRYVHRVVEVDGERARLRGDANSAVDPGWVTQDEVTGVVAAHLPGAIAVAIVAATSLPGRIALALALVFLFLIPFFPRRGEGPRRARSSFDAVETPPGGRP